MSSKLNRKSRWICLRQFLLVVALFRVDLVAQFQLIVDNILPCTNTICCYLSNIIMFNLSPFPLPACLTGKNWIFPRARVDDVYFFQFTVKIHGLCLLWNYKKESAATAISTATAEAATNNNRIEISLFRSSSNVLGNYSWILLKYTFFPFFANKFIVASVKYTVYT